MPGIPLVSPTTPHTRTLKQVQVSNRLVLQWETCTTQKKKMASMVSLHRRDLPYPHPTNGNNPFHPLHIFFPSPSPPLPT